MNIACPYQNSFQPYLQKASSTGSLSTDGSTRSPRPESMEAMSPYEQNIEHFDIANLEGAQMIDQAKSQNDQQFKIDVSTYLQKRKNVMNWMQRYGAQLYLSRNATSAAHLYCDLFYHNNPYNQPDTKMILTCLMIIASKHSDSNVLFTSNVAYVCDYDYQQLSRLELECCLKLDFQLSRETYVMEVDHIINTIHYYTSLNLYQENQEKYVMLRMIHRIVERLYCEHYQWEGSKSNIKYIFTLALAEQFPKYPNLNKVLQSIDMNESEFINMEIRQTINLYIKEWKQTKENQVRELYRNRKDNKKYINYSEFCVQYFQ